MMAFFENRTGNSRAAARSLQLKRAVVDEAVPCEHGPFVSKARQPCPLLAAV